MYQIYHNPKCSKSRATLQILRDRGVELEVIEYLKTPPSVQELDVLLKALKKQPQEVVRVKEDCYQQLDLQSKDLSHEQWLTVLSKNPILLERPIVLKGSQAILGRPPENVLKLL